MSWCIYDIAYYIKNHYIPVTSDRVIQRIKGDVLLPHSVDSLSDGESVWS